MKHRYKIGWLTYSLSELTWGQDKKLAELVTYASSIGSDEQITIGKLKDLLVKYDLLGVFLGVVLKPRRDPMYLLWKLFDVIKWLLRIRKGPFSYVDPDPVPHSVLAQMFDDFFLLNKPLIEKLKESGNALGLIAMAAEKMASPSPSISQIPLSER